MESDVGLTKLFEVRRAGPTTDLNLLLQSDVLSPLDTVGENVESVEIGDTGGEFGLHRACNLIHLDVLRAVVLENGSRRKIAVCDFLAADVDEGLAHSHVVGY